MFLSGDELGLDAIDRRRRQAGHHQLGGRLDVALVTVTSDDGLADRSTWEDYDVDAAGEQGYGFVRLNQLAVEHLTGVC